MFLKGKNSKDDPAEQCSYNRQNKEKFKKYGLSIAMNASYEFRIYYFFLRTTLKITKEHLY